MQFTRKKKNIKKGRIIFVSVIAAIIAALTVAAVLLSRAEPKAEETEEKVLIPIIEGVEGRYNSYPIAYPYIDSSKADISVIEIANASDGKAGEYKTNEYKLVKNESDSYEFWYKEEGEDEYKKYSPSILSQEDGMGYDDLHAVVKGDGYDRIPIITYLVVALRTPYFDDRIQIDKANEAAQLEKYGLGRDGDGNSKAQAVVSFKYTDESGEEKSHFIEVGDNTITGSGFYFRVDNRDYIYVTRENNYFNYVLLGLESYINPVLVANGFNDQQALFAPHITPGYKQWKNELITEGIIKPEDMSIITDVLGTVKAYMPEYIFYNKTEEEMKEVDSYSWLDLGSYVFNMTDNKNNALYSYLKNALSGVALSKEAELNLRQSLLYARDIIGKSSYQYKIKSIDAIITDSGDITTEGTSVGGARYLLVTYEYWRYNTAKEVWERKNYVTNISGDGDTLKEYAADYHGIIDLDRLEAEDRAKFEKVGALSEEEQFIIEYEYSSGAKSRVFYLDEVLEIYEIVKRDADGNVIEKKKTNVITDNSFVVYRYYYSHAGTAQSAKIGYIYMTGTEDEAEYEKNQKIRQAIRTWMSDSESNDAIEVFDESYYRDIISDFITYEFENISSYITGELVVAFKFINDSERDPFYGESYFEKTEDFMIYALNQDNCETIVKHLGGIAETSQATGLVGTETVKVGITAESLIEFGCTAYTVHYSLPRGLYVSEETAEDEQDEYSWLRSIKFSLYVSEAVPDDADSSKMVRYVASTIYDIIVKIDANELGYLELEQVDYWARRSLILTSVENVSGIKIELMMDDLSGEYDFFLYHDYGIIQDHDLIEVFAYRSKSANFKTKLDALIKDGDMYSLADFYSGIVGENATDGNDYLGTSMFKNFLLMLFGTRYMGTLTEEEQKSALGLSADAQLSSTSRPKAKPLMRISVKLNESLYNDERKNIYHAYEFYRCDSNKILVRLYEWDVDSSTPKEGKSATDFYIDSFAFNKIVTNFIGLMNGENIDPNVAYPDFKPIG